MINFTKLFIVFLYFLCVSTYCLGKSNNVERRDPYTFQEAEGYGATFDEALKVAFHDAVRKAIGFYLVARKITIDDSARVEICTNTDAYVHGYEILEQTERENGEISLKIRAKIIRKEIARQLEAKTTTTIDEASIIDIKRRKDDLSEVKKSLQILFENFPDNLLEMSVLGRLELSDDVNTENKDYYDITFKIRMSVNQEAYSIFCSKLKMLLSVISNKSEQFRDGDYKQLKEIFTASNNESRIYIEEFTDPRKKIEYPNTVKYAIYDVSSYYKDYIEQLSSLTQQKRTTIQVNFLDENENVVHRDYFRLNYSLYPIAQAPMNLRVLYLDKQKDNKLSKFSIDGSCILLAPFLNYCLAVDFTVSTRIPSNEIDKLKECTIKLFDNKTSPDTNFLSSKVRPVKSAIGHTFTKGLPYLGVKVDAASSGVRIKKIFPNTPAHHAGLKKNDVILKINDYSVKSPEDFFMYIQSRFFPGNVIKLSVKRDYQLNIFNSRKQSKVRRRDNSIPRLSWNSSRNVVSYFTEGTHTTVESNRNNDAASDEYDDNYVTFSISVRLAELR